MIVSQYRRNYSVSEGNKTEDKFSRLMNSRGNTCIKSSKHDDIYKHIDFYVNNIGIDVKGNRHLETIWVELNNVKGKKGWLRGDAEYIVFDVVELKSFCFFKRDELLEFCSNITEATKDKTEYRKLYSRKDRDDLLIKYRFEDIKHLQIQQISYE